MNTYIIGMKKGVSKISGKNGYIESHHIIEKRFDKNSKMTIDLSLDEHREYHDHSNEIKNQDASLGFFISWFGGRKYLA